MTLFAGSLPWSVWLSVVGTKGTLKGNGITLTTSPPLLQNMSLGLFLSLATIYSVLFVFSFLVSLHVLAKRQVRLPYTRWIQTEGPGFLMSTRCSLLCCSFAALSISRPSLRCGLCVDMIAVNRSSHLCQPVPHKFQGGQGQILSHAGEPSATLPEASSPPWMSSLQ